jgi:hypothetical protein
MPNIDRDDEHATRYEMSDTKPTLDEQITDLKKFLQEPIGNFATPMHYAILASLERLKQIESAEMPEPVATVTSRNFKTGGIEVPTSVYLDKIVPVGTKLYGPELLAYAQRMEAEAQHQTRESFRLARLHERAERERDALRKDAERYWWITEMWPLEITRLVHSFTVDATSVDVHKAIDNAMDEGRG